MTINNLVTERDAHDLYYFKRKYKLGPEIGRGGFGVVYAGYRIEDRFSVAVKYVARRNITEWSILNGRNVPLEIALLDTCKNLTGVIRTIDWYERQDGYFVVMERPTHFCDLFDFISDRGPLDEIVARTLFKQIVETAIACKAANVIHRDIKDENIIIDINAGQIKLIDFGSGAFLRSGDYTDFEGTRVYSPPEWILYQRYDGLKATTWSLGILLFDLIAGDIPFHHDHEICSGTINWKQHISMECRDLIQKCLALDAKKRFSLNEILNHKWMKGTVRKLGPADLLMKKRPINGIKTTNPEEQGFEIMQMASLNTTSSPPNADELFHLEQEKSRQHLHVHPHQHVSSTKSAVKEPVEKEEPASSSSKEQSSSKVEESDESENEGDNNGKDTNEKTKIEDDQENRELREKAEAHFANNNADMPSWWKMSIYAAVNEDSRNNNADLLSPSQKKNPGFYYQTTKASGSDQNLPSAVLYEGAPTIQLQHPSTSHYGEQKHRPSSNAHKNSSWNESKKHNTNGCISSSSVNITQPIYRKSSNVVVYPATVASFNGMASKNSLANLAIGRRPQHHRSTPRTNQLHSTLPRSSKSSSIGRQEGVNGGGQKKQMDRKTAIDSGFSSGSNGYVLSGSPPGGSFVLGSY